MAAKTGKPHPTVEVPMEPNMYRDSGPMTSGMTSGASRRMVYVYI